MKKKILDREIAFIACSKLKRRYPSKARDLYQGALFKKALSYCLQNFNEVFILSAKHGLVNLDDVIDPYEETLNTKNKKERADWAKKVARQLKEREVQGNFWFFTGQKYHEAFEGHKPLEGLSLGNQLSWFDKQKRKQLKQKGKEILWGDSSQNLQ